MSIKSHRRVASSNRDGFGRTRDLRPAWWTRVLTILAVVAITAVALGLRFRAVELLPVDYDEDDYLRAGQQYAEAIRAGDWAALTELNYRTEHPPLAKLAYGLALLALPPADEVPDRPTTTMSGVTELSAAATHSTIALPSTSVRALSRPIREALPPARMTPRGFTGLP